MSFTMDIYNLLIRYTKESEGLDITLADLQNLPWWRCVWGNWKAQAYYKINGFYERLEDVPEDLKEYTIQTDKLNTQYFADGHKQTMDLETCKKIFRE